MEQSKYTLYDWLQIVLGVTIVIFLCIGFKACGDHDFTPVTTKPVKEEINAELAQKAYDDLLIIKARQIDSLEMIVAESKKKSGRIIIKYKNIHDTIMITPEVEQFPITKMLCPATGDSINLKEINGCLATGKQHEELYKEVVVELGAKEKEVVIQKELVVEGQKNMLAKDTLIVSYRDITADLTKKVEKEQRRKKAWRNVSIGAGTFILIQILLSVL